jgi:membrane-associated phospholipid phosphatase
LLKTHSHHNHKILFLFGFLTLIITFIPIKPITAQESPNDTLVKLNGKYLLSYWTDTKTIVSEPFHWKAKQWSTFAGVTAVWAVTFAFDQEIHDFFQKNRTQAGDDLSKYVIEPWGSGLYSLPLLAGIYIFSNGNNHNRNVALTGVKAFLLSGGAAFVGKQLFHRHRPYEDDPSDPYDWDGPYPFTISYTSFPSGHTTTAFAVASVLAIGYKDKPWIGITSYSVATLVGISRIYETKHWASDVVAGAALGTFIGVTLSKANFKNLQIGPGYSSNGLGINVVWRVQ